VVCRRSIQRDARIQSNARRERRKREESMQLCDVVVDAGADSSKVVDNCDLALDRAAVGPDQFLE
jgi:hypothetical protein